VAGGQGDWSKLFSTAFAKSRNAMLLLDGKRVIADVNGAYVKLIGYRRKDLIGTPMHKYVLGGPIASPAQWKAALHKHEFSGEVELLPVDGSRVAVQWAATTEVVTGRHLVLFVAVNTSRWGPRFRRDVTPKQKSDPLSAREREVVRLVAAGQTGPEIADELLIAHDTVRTHVRNAMEKSGARSRAHLVAKALGEGLVLG
jgi:PAS domain S-box-containing protein